MAVLEQSLEATSRASGVTARLHWIGEADLVACQEAVWSTEPVTFEPATGHYEMSLETNIGLVHLAFSEDAAYVPSEFVPPWWDVAEPYVSFQVIGGGVDPEYEAYSVFLDYWGLWQTISDLSDPAAMLRLIVDDATSAVDAGIDQIQGIDARRIDLTVPDKASHNIQFSNGDEPARFSVWIDDDGLLRRWELAAIEDPELRWVVDYTDYGIGVDLPDPSLVAPWASLGIDELNAGIDPSFVEPPLVIDNRQTDESDEFLRSCGDKFKAVFGEG